MSKYQASAAGKGSNRREGSGFEDNFDKIFKSKPIQRGRYIQHPETGKMVAAEDYQRPSSGREYAAVHGDITAFVSPIDGSVIDDRSKLREHNKRHGVTNSADYSGDYLKKANAKRQVSPKQAKQERLSSIRKSLHQHGYYD